MSLAGHYEAVAGDRKIDMTDTEAAAGIGQERRLVTEIPGPKSRELLERRAAAVARAVFQTVPISVRAAFGSIVEDVDGNRLIDLASGVSVLNAGNTPPRVVEAIKRQAELYTHACFQIATYEPYVELAEVLNVLMPGDFEKKTVLLNTGAEAVENAVKIARYATGRPGVVVFDHAFHGRSYMAMSLTGKVMPYSQGFGPLPGGVHRVAYSYPYRPPCGRPADECGFGCLALAIDFLQTHVRPENVACLLIEPILGEGGVVVPADGFLSGLRAFCDDHGILLVLDEVQTGFGRTGRWWASEHFGIVPDLTATAKSIGGGLPLAAVTGRADLMDSVHVGGLGGTFGGNPIACEAGLEVIREIGEDRLLDAAEAIGSKARARFTSLKDTLDVIGEVRGIGAMVGIELVKEASGQIPDGDLALRVVQRAHRDGVIVQRVGTYDNVIRLLPPLTISEALLDEGLSVIEQILISEAKGDRQVN
jgi:4-aminobutyrate aminotransferase / (S)-3-amino-2-methylpropionate transaminase / 5-aminovalerate transaminase